MHRRTTTKIFGRGNNYIAADSNPGGSLLEIAPLQAKQDNKRFSRTRRPSHQYVRVERSYAFRQIVSQGLAFPKWRLTILGRINGKAYFGGKFILNYVV